MPRSRRGWNTKHGTRPASDPRAADLSGRLGAYPSGRSRARSASRGTCRNPGERVRLHVGAEVLERGVRFRVWAPAHREVAVVVEDVSGAAMLEARLENEGDGYFSGVVAEAHEGTLYRYRLGAARTTFPDPASRYQPRGPHGPSQVVDPGRYVWADDEWEGVELAGQVVYEMHLGTFTPEGTWVSALRELDVLARLGVTLLEIMPVAEFCGDFGWGYDGVDLFAPMHVYGAPDDMRSFVDRAHALGLGVILDVVYNHLGPDGNYLKEFSPHYFSSRRATDWGDAINYDGESSAPVRAFFLGNAAYWIGEYHVDGLRLDATQDIHDGSEVHIMADLAERVRAAAGERSVLLIAENEPQNVSLLRPREDGGYGLDAVWNDDFHHSAMVALSGRREAYYTDYRGRPQEFISAAKYGYLYQGQYYSWQQQRRGTPTFEIEPPRFVTYIQNHDQVANSSHGFRCHSTASPGCYRAMTALLLLGPGTPMLFQGQEFAASSPFLYFADHHPEIADSVRDGRRAFLAQFPSCAARDVQARLADPSERSTFARSILDRGERERHADVVRLHEDLLRLRRDDFTFRAQGAHGIDGAVLGDEAFVLRFFAPDGDDRLLVINLGPDLELVPAPEPLLAPPEGKRWELLWASEDPRYGGGGARPLDTDDVWVMTGHAAIVLRPDGRN